MTIKKVVLHPTAAWDIVQLPVLSILSAANVKNELCVFCEVDEDAEPIDVNFVVFSSDQPVPDGIAEWAFIGSTIIRGNDYHVYCDYQEIEVTIDLEEEDE